MLLAQPYQISEIDEYASTVLGISKQELMRRAGVAVADAVRSPVRVGSSVVILAGKGNNGGDGYAAATLLMPDYSVMVVDVFAAGQRTDEGKHFLDKFSREGGRIITLADAEAVTKAVTECDCTVDAVFGTGFRGDYPLETVRAHELLCLNDHSVRIAIDVPLGVDASDGSVRDEVIYRADATVALGFIKPGLVSYPAKEYVGKLIYDNIGLQNSDIINNFEFKNYAIDRDLALSLLPQRPDNSNKGSFGKALIITGSDAFVGAARLSLEATLRGGVGLTTYLGESSLCDALSVTFPEAIYRPCRPSALTDADLDYVSGLAAVHTAILVGSGSSRSEGLYRLVERLLSTEGSPLILDADAINILSEHPEGIELIRASRRKVILTPHPLELSRLMGIPTDTVQAGRIAIAKRFAADNHCVLVLKGAATVVTDGNECYVNTSGSSALAKAGSGDVLAGVLTSFVASGSYPIRAAPVAVYFHGLAADALADEFSCLGVTPSDLPREVARQIRRAEQGIWN